MSFKNFQHFFLLYLLEPVLKWISKKINSKPFPIILNDFNGWKFAENVFILENLRFYKEEEGNDDKFSKKLSSLAQIYVNDAFASSHRAHASIVGITKYIPSFAGLNLLKEVENLSRVLENPKRPLTVIIGGAKIETKLPLVSKMHSFADYVLVGGEIAENDKILLKIAHEKITGQKSALIVADLTQNSKDITEKSAENFVQISKNSNTI
ncbi:MAG: phosphoglycerate kinase, partial [Candidatus Levybacteria bacterium RBG_13_35_9]